MQAFLLQSSEQLGNVAALMLQLRPQYKLSEILKQIKRQQTSGYQLAFVEHQKEIICVAGFVIAEKLAWGKHIYIDDLITDESSRAKGAGKCLLMWLKQYALAQGCKEIHLDSGVQRFAAHKFYLNSGFNIASHHFSLKLDGS